MAGVTFGDELVRDYLVYRGFLSALKVFDSEVKADKDRGFRPDHIVEHLSSCITNMDLTALREAWSHLEQRVFSRLEHSFLSTARKLENALLRMFLVTCIVGSRHDKLLEFFEKMTPELQVQSEWKEWFALPFLKNTDENPIFAVYFTREWQNTMLVSLHNFISVVFQSIAAPSLLSYEEELFHLSTLQEENEILKTKLASLMPGDNDASKPLTDNSNQDSLVPVEPMDDFYAIAREAPSENVSRSIKSLIKNISSGLPASPVLARHVNDVRMQDDYTSAGALKSKRSKPRSPSVPPQVSSHRMHSDSTHYRQKNLTPPKPPKEELGHQETDSKNIVATKTHTTLRHASMPALTDPRSGFLILSQEEYTEHHSFITHCKFNNSGLVVASADVDGVIKIWNASPSIHTLSTNMSKSSVLALEWAPKRERLLLHGSGFGKVRLYDTKERKIIAEVVPNRITSDVQKILCISCNPLETNFAVSASNDNNGSLSLYDMRNLQLESLLQISPRNVPCFCCSFNHNGQLLLVGSCDGQAHIFDLRTYENIASWTAHSGNVLAIQFSPDENTCLTMGQDGKFIQWSINKTGHQIGELPIHAKAAFPFVQNNIPAGKLFAFNNDATHVLTCGPVSGVIYKVSGKSLTHALNIGGHNNSVTAVDWSTAMECSTCLCGSADGRITVTTLMTQ